MFPGKLFNRNVTLAKGAGFYNDGQLYPVYVNGSPQAISAAGAANVTSYKTNWTTTGADALTLADGSKVGQLKLIQLIVDYWIYSIVLMVLLLLFLLNRLTQPFLG